MSTVTIIQPDIRSLVPLRRLPCVSRDDNHHTCQRTQAYFALRQVLQSQQLTPGARLSENAWSRRIGVNRSAIREAFARLAGEGLLMDNGRAGYFVPRLDGDTHDVAKACWLLESIAVASYVEQKGESEEPLCQLNKLCDELEWLLEKNYLVDPGQADSRFHKGLVELAGNHRLATMYGPFRDMLVAGLPTSAEGWAIAGRAMVREHRAILITIKERRAESAKRLLRMHILGEE